MKKINDEVSSKEIEFFLDHFSKEEIKNFNQYYIGSYDDSFELLSDLLFQENSYEELISLIYPYLNHKGLLYELAMKHGLIIHEDFDYIVFKSRI